MRGGALPAALLCAMLALALGFAPARARLAAILVAAVAAVAVVLAGWPAGWREPAFAGCWLSLAATALSVHLPGGIGARLAPALAANAGLWSGAVIAAEGAPADLARALPWLLLAFPAALLVSRRLGIVIRVVASWAVAVAVLAALLPLAPTPGYAPDHMD